MKVNFRVNLTRDDGTGPEYETGWSTI